MSWIWPGIWPSVFFFRAKILTKGKVFGMVRLGFLNMCYACQWNSVVLLLNLSSVNAPDEYCYKVLIQHVNLYSALNSFHHDSRN